MLSARFPARFLSFVSLVALLFVALPAGAADQKLRSRSAREALPHYLPLNEVKTWQRLNHRAVEALFGAESAFELNRMRKRVKRKSSLLLWTTYENPWGSDGGVLSVGRLLPRALAKTCRHAVSVSPLFKNLEKAAKRPEVNEGIRFLVPYGEAIVPCTAVVRHDGTQPWHLIDTAHSGFINADGGTNRTNPYVYNNPDDNWGSTEFALRRDSLFFSRAVAEMIAAMERADLKAIDTDVGENSHLVETISAMRGARGGTIVHAQDWQTVATALTVKEAWLDGRIRRPVGTAHTWHNFFDAHVPEYMLRNITRYAQNHRWPAVTAEGDLREGVRETLGQRMLVIGDTPVSTVSSEYARSLHTDSMMRDVYVAHLHPELRLQKVTGTENGLFKVNPAPFSEEAYAAAEKGDVRPILKEKAERHDAAIEIARDYKDDRIIGRLKPPTSEHTRYYMGMGRMDPNQKGFDVAAHAVDVLEAQGFDGRYIFTPAAGDDVAAYLRHMEAVAKRHPGKVQIFPFRMEEGYFEMMGGVDFLEMPSLYEPFGGATEAFMVGTVPIVRATGGLIQQVPRTVGIAYREGRDSLPVELRDRWAHINEAFDWQEITKAGNPQGLLDATHGSDDPIYHDPAAYRMRFLTYQAMVGALAEARREGARLIEEQPEVYGQMLAKGYKHAIAHDWDSSAKKYGKVLDCIARD